MPKNAVKERKTLYLANPAPAWQVVAGKFLAAAFIYAIMLILSGIYPLAAWLLGGNVDAKAGFCYLALFCLGLAYIAIGIAFSSATANQFVSAAATFLALFFMQGLGASFAAVADKGAAALLQTISLDSAQPERLETVRQSVTSALLWLNPAAKLALFNKGIFRLTPLIYFISFIIAFLAVATVMVRRRYAVRSRDAVMLVVAVIILAAGNWLVDSAWGKSWRWDITSSRVYSLGSESKTILSELAEPILIWGLFDRDASNEENDTVLFVEQYRALGNGNIEVHYANPESHRELLGKFGLPTDLELDGVYFIVMNKSTKRYRLIRGNDLFGQRRDVGGEVMQLLTLEQAFTGAVHGVEKANSIKTVLTRGNGEEKKRPIFDSLISLITASGCEIGPLDLALGQTIPDETKLLLMLAPQTDISAAASRQLTNYVKNGGSLLLLAGYSHDAWSNLPAFAKEFAINITDNRLKETHSELLMADDPFSFVAVSPESDLLPGVQSLLAVMAREVRASETVASRFSLTNLLQSSNSVIAESETPESGRPGIRTIGVASEIKGIKPGKLVVIGSSDAFSDPVLNGLGAYSGTHRRFLARIVSWLLDQEDKGISIHAKGIPNYCLALTSGKMGLAYISAYFGMVGLPLLLLLAAVFVHWRRRRL